jgi:hypothetical protein
MKRTDEERRLRKHLIELTATVTSVVARVDTLMKTPKRANDIGEVRVLVDDLTRQIAQMMNSLDFANDCARHFGLGVPLSNAPRAAQAVHAADVEAKL